MRRDTGENPEQGGSQPPRQPPGQFPQQTPAQRGRPQSRRPPTAGVQGPGQPGGQGPQGPPPRQPPGQGGPQPRGQSSPSGPPAGWMAPPQGQGIQGRQSVQGQEPLPPQPGTQGPPPSPGMQSGMAQQGGPGVGQQPGVAQSPGRPGIAGPFLESVSIDDIIQTDVVTAQPDTPLTEVAERLASEDVGAVILVEDEEPAGLVTDRKIALSIDEFDDPSEATAEEIATDDLVTGTTTLTVFEVLNRMNDDNVRRLPVVNEDGTLEGIVTLDDLLVLLATELEKATSIIQSQSPRL